MIQNILYNGKVILDFDPEKHQYFRNEKLVPNVTNITKPAYGGGGLTYWIKNMCASKFRELVKPNTSYDELELIEIEKKIKEASDESMKRSGNIGSLVHEAVEKKLLTGEDTNFTQPECLNAYTQFQKYYETQDFKVLFCERQFYYQDDNYEYCGTADLVVEDKDGLIIKDWKTSNSIRDYNTKSARWDYVMQLTAYALAYEREFGEKITRGEIVQLPKKGKYKIELVDINQSMRECFFACLKLYQTTNNKEKK